MYICIYIITPSGILVINQLHQALDGHHLAAPAKPQKMKAKSWKKPGSCLARCMAYGMQFSGLLDDVGCWGS